jgi:hypothetical protein
MLEAVEEALLKEALLVLAVLVVVVLEDLQLHLVAQLVTALLEL